MREEIQVGRTYTKGKRSATIEKIDSKKFTYIYTDKGAYGKEAFKRIYMESK